MAKFCSNCGNKVDEKAVICVKCGYAIKEDNISNNKNNKIPWWAILLIVFGCLIITLPILLVIIFGIIFDNIDIEESVKDYYHEIEDEFREEKNTEYIEGKIEESIDTENYTITLEKVNKYNKLDNFYYNEINDSKEYVVFFFEIKNNTNNNQYISSFDFEGYVDDKEIDKLYLSDEIEEYKNLYGYIDKGETMKGFIAYQVDREWNELEVHFIDEIDYYNPKEIIFKIKNNELEQDKDL